MNDFPDYLSGVAALTGKTPEALINGGRPLFRIAVNDGAATLVSWDASLGDPPTVAQIVAAASSAPARAARLAPLIKAECGRRIYAVVTDNAQKNTLANVLSGTLTGADLDTWKAGVAWIAEMQATARALVHAADPTYAQDAHWPQVPAGVAALAARF